MRHFMDDAPTQNIPTDNQNATDDIEMLTKVCAQAKSSLSNPTSTLPHCIFRQQLTAILGF